MNNKHYNKITGAQGEMIAEKFLKDKGYKILEKNYKNTIGEIDIIAKDKDIIVFVEVKYRKDDYFGLPREAVGKNKQFKIKKVASVYLNNKRLFNNQVRFDVVEVLGDNITHLEDCF